MNIHQQPRATVEGHGFARLVRTVEDEAGEPFALIWEAENGTGHVLACLNEDGSEGDCHWVPGTMGSVMLRLGYLQSS